MNKLKIRNSVQFSLTNISKIRRYLDRTELYRDFDPEVCYAPINVIPAGGEAGHGVGI